MEFFSSEFGRKSAAANMREARDCGYELVCAWCGCGGVEDDDEMHDSFCPVATEEYKAEEEASAAAFSDRIREILGKDNHE